MSSARKPTAAPTAGEAPSQKTESNIDRAGRERQLPHSERLASLGILAAGVAHEILNPLASVLAGIEALRRRIAEVPRGPDSRAVAEADRILDILEQEIGRARNIANRMMLLARPDSEEMGWLDVNGAVEETIALLRYQMNVQGVETHLPLEQGLAPIWVRGGGLRGVLMNLAMNAVQAMERGGKLTIRTRDMNGTLFIEVEDTGPGIPTDKLHRIWDPFYTTKPPGEGTGLGLSISQTVVQKHGGSIQVRNVEPHGARFTVAIPVDSPRR
jgi:signal transduction histidine kinase